jgi:phosphoribosylaminoimidazolecarboxamide formyltransferase/IMP cyclohydrolase
LPANLSIVLPRRQALRYGENPHQKAALYAAGATGIGGAEQLHGKELSYNNLVDLDAAWALIQEFSAPAAAIIKHTNPCGCAEQDSLVEAYRKAYEADPVSAYGGVLAFNRELDGRRRRKWRSCSSRRSPRRRIPSRRWRCSRRKRICGW